MKKGFTLVELIGVMVILSLIIVFTYPIIIDVLKGENDNKDKYESDMIINAAELYKENNGDICISIDTLKETKYLKSVDAKYNGKFVKFENNKWEIKSSCS